MPVRMLGFVAMLPHLLRCRVPGFGRHVVVNQVKRQLDHLQPFLALVL